MKIKKVIGTRPLLFDGAMGAMLQRAGLRPGGLPELMNLTHPDVVADIHSQFAQAGAEVITANTFQANDLNLADSPHSTEEVIAAGVALAKQSGAPWTALDVGPLGQLMKPMGTLSFAKAYAHFRKIMMAGAAAGADLIVVETMSDLHEAKAAILAAKENTSLPVACTLTFQEGGRTFVGCDPVTAALTLSSLGANAVGVNCSLGPRESAPIVEAFLRYSRVPVMVQPNAGLPSIEGQEIVYRIKPEEYAEEAAEMVRSGAAIIGGCCGVTPEHIAALRRKLELIEWQPPKPEIVCAATSGVTTVFLDQGITIIGERINPTGKKKLQAAIREYRLPYILGEAIDQAGAGCDLLDVNVGLPDIEEPAMLQQVVAEVQGVVSLPLQIDSADPDAIEAAVRIYNGRPLINSVNGKLESLNRILPIARRYGALVVGLTLDENGIPPTAEGRLEVARRIVEAALRHGLPREDVLIDCLALTASAQQEQVRETLKAIALVKSQLGVRTTLGVSNVSFGLPCRDKINATFLAAAFGAGLDAPILNPLSERYREAADAFRVLNNQDREAAAFISLYSNQAEGKAASPPSGRSLMDIIAEGRRNEAAPKVTQMLEDTPPLDIINLNLIPALDRVGAGFEAGTLFLSQLMLSADTAGSGFEVIRDHMRATGQKLASRGRILMATVQGDIHDIGKNIVRMILENYGYDVLDLGKDAPINDVVEAIRREDIRLAGLSALMTATVASMKDTIAAVREAGLPCSFFVVGAVLTQEYADFVGADFYARDAMESVAIAGRFFDNSDVGSQA